MGDQPLARQRRAHHRREPVGAADDVAGQPREQPLVLVAALAVGPGLPADALQPEAGQQQGAPAPAVLRGDGGLQSSYPGSAERRGGGRGHRLDQPGRLRLAGDAAPGQDGGVAVDGDGRPQVGHPGAVSRRSVGCARASPGPEPGPRRGSPPPRTATRRPPCSWRRAGRPRPCPPSPRAARAWRPPSGGATASAPPRRRRRRPRARWWSPSGSAQRGDACLAAARTPASTCAVLLRRRLVGDRQEAEPDRAERRDRHASAEAG